MKNNKFITWLAALFLAVMVGFISWALSHTHCGMTVSRTYCPNCYKPAVIRIDLQKYCEECGYNFYLNYDELPDSVK